MTDKKGSLMDGTTRALMAAVLRLAEENGKLAGMLRDLGVDVEADAGVETDTAADTAPVSEVLEAAGEDIPDAEFARLLHETALPLGRLTIEEPDGRVTEIEVAATVESEDTAADLFPFPEAEW